MIIVLLLVFLVDLQINKEKYKDSIYILHIVL